MNRIYAVYGLGGTALQSIRTSGDCECHSCIGHGFCGGGGGGSRKYIQSLEIDSLL